MLFLKVRCNNIVSVSKHSVLNRMFKCHCDKIAAMWKDESILGVDLLWFLTSSRVVTLQSHTRTYHPGKGWTVLLIQKTNYLIKNTISCHIPLFLFLVHTSLLSNYQHEFYGRLAWLLWQTQRWEQGKKSSQLNGVTLPVKALGGSTGPRAGRWASCESHGCFSLSDRP